MDRAERKRKRDQNREGSDSGADVFAAAQPRPPEDWPITNGALLGSGVSGEVVKWPGENLAIKQFTDGSPRCRESECYRETWFMERLAAVTGFTSQVVKADETRIAMRLATCSLERFIAAGTTTSCSLLSLLLMARQLLCGLYRAHCAGLLLRDIKPGNMLVYRRRRANLYVVRYSDFSLSLVQGACPLTNTGDIGTDDYYAPCQLALALQPSRLRSWAFGPECDCCSLGLSLAELFLGKSLVMGERKTVRIAAYRKLPRELDQKLAKLHAEQQRIVVELIGVKAPPALDTIMQRSTVWWRASAKRLKAAQEFEAETKLSLGLEVDTLERPLAHQLNALMQEDAVERKLDAKEVELWESLVPLALIAFSRMHGSAYPHPKRLRFMLPEALCVAFRMSYLWLCDGQALSVEVFEASFAHAATLLGGCNLVTREHRQLLQSLPRQWPATALRIHSLQTGHHPVWSVLFALLSLDLQAHALAPDKLAQSAWSVLDAAASHPEYITALAVYYGPGPESDVLNRLTNASSFVRALRSQLVRTEVFDARELDPFGHRFPHSLFESAHQAPAPSEPEKPSAKRSAQRARDAPRNRNRRRRRVAAPASRQT